MNPEIRNEQKFANSSSLEIVHYFFQRTKKKTFQVNLMVCHKMLFLIFLMYSVLNFIGNFEREIFHRFDVLLQVNPEMRYEPEFADHVPPELLWFQELVQNPLSLQVQCRFLIRHILGTSVQNKVRRLPLPEKIKGFVLLNDILSTDAES